MNTMMITALLASAGLAQAGAPAPNQCGKDCGDCCAAKTVSAGDHEIKVIEEFVIDLSDDDDAGHGGSKAFMIIIDEDGEAHMKTLDPGNMHKMWRGMGDGDNKHKMMMKFGMGDGEGMHGFTMPKDGFSFKWDGEGKPFSFDGSPEEMKKFIGKLKGFSRHGAEGMRGFMMPEGKFRFKSGDDDHSFMFKGKRGAHGKFFTGDGDQMHEEIEIVQSDDNKPRLGVGLEPDEDGLVIVQVMEGFPAEHAGLETGDVIVKINGEGPATMDSLREALEYSHIALSLATDDGERTVTIRFDDDGHAKGMMKRHGKAHKGMKGKAHKDGRAKPHMKFRIQTDGERGEAKGSNERLHTMLKKLDNKGEIAEQVQKALHEAMKELGGSLDDDAKMAIEEAMRSLRELDLNTIVEGRITRSGKARGDRKGDAPRFRARVERHRDGQGDREGRARARVLRSGPHVDGPKKARAPRNRADDARFKRLEDRLDRIERLLEAIERQS